MKNKTAFLFYSLFSVTIFLGAFLLFQVQPIIGKYILPWFGGTSFVWITSLLFFQTLLLGGYFYSFLLSKLHFKLQIGVHVLLILLTTIITLLLFSQWKSPITPDITWKPGDTFSPVLQVLAMLSISVGLPYFLLSTTSTLLQKWYSFLPHNKSPYSLYALSNAGSLLAIATYPFLIEPYLSIQRQGYLWSIIFVLVCLLLFICSIFLLRHKKYLHIVENFNLETHSWKYHWLVLPAISSIMLLAGTHYLTQGIAPIPFLWLLPLGLYLLSFILCFSEKPFYLKNLFAYSYLLTLPFILAFLMQPPVIGLSFELILFGVMLFSCFMMCHGELYKQKPEPKQLNAFYLAMALGSVLGSLLVAIIAPLFLIGLHWEFLIGLFLTSLIAVHVLVGYNQPFFNDKILAFFTSSKEKKLFVTLVSCGFFLIMAGLIYLEQISNTQGTWRNFYGTLRILQRDSKAGTLRCLINGKIIHGCQSSDPQKEMLPTSYFGETGIGLAIKTLRNKNDMKPLRIGVIGLGVGTIAAYGKNGDVIRFYELNPVDIDLAKTRFTYLSKTPATIETIIGDGRLSMENELNEKKDQKYNLFIVDAFNDDAIPVHLLTQQAFEIYKRHLVGGGIIAVHISNTYLDLKPIITKAAESQKMHIVIVQAPATNGLQSQSIWAFLTADNNLFKTEGFKKAKTLTSDTETIQLWTDDYSNLFQIFKYTP